MLVRLAQEGRPEVQAAAAAAANSRAALSLARADRIPVPSLGPVYERNETGAVFYGLALSSPGPAAEHGRSAGRPARGRVSSRLRGLGASPAAGCGPGPGGVGEVESGPGSGQRTHARFEPIRPQTERMQRLYDAGQADLLKLLQVQRRFIEARNVELDTIWQTTQAYADLLAATGGTPLLSGAPRAVSNHRRTAIRHRRLLDVHWGYLPLFLYPPTPRPISRDSVGEIKNGCTAFHALAALRPSNHFSKDLNDQERVVG